MSSFGQLQMVAISAIRSPPHVAHDLWRHAGAQIRSVFVDRQRKYLPQTPSGISTCQVLPTPMSSRWCASWRNVQRLLLKSLPSLVPQQKVRWWDTPEGFVLVGASTKNELPSEADAWWIYQQQELKMNGVKYNMYPHGEFYPKTWQSPSNIVISYDDNDGAAWSGKVYKKNLERNNLLRVALGILDNASNETIVGEL